MTVPCSRLVAPALLRAAQASDCSPIDGDGIGWAEDPTRSRAWDCVARIGGGRVQFMTIDVTDGDLPEADRESSGYRAELGEAEHPDDNFWFFVITRAETWDHVADTWNETEVAADATLGFGHVDGGEEHRQIAFCTRGMTSTAEGPVWQDPMVRDTDGRFPEADTAGHAHDVPGSSSVLVVAPSSPLPRPSSRPREARRRGDPGAAAENARGAVRP